MSDDAAARYAAANRVSIRAVLDTGQEDIHAVLREAGIYDPVAVPVVFGETDSLTVGILGDGRTPNVSGVLEMDPSSAGSAAPAAGAAVRPTAVRPDQVRTTRMFPPALGGQAMAPIG